ncbi:hypothetical protein [Halostella pelagica]|uniref:hypothetical protein n=1 Tax=Halostella pelagica TaxID=2583824 RepID=UPI0010809C4B|nr:hypothetical protein [Halostella pelagica]
MAAEPFTYRARKWAVQQISPVWHRPDQLERLEETEWDVLVVLDACRYDVLREVAEWPVDAVQSPGSNTSEWLSSVKAAGTMHDAYVSTANVQYSKVDVGSEVRACWETHWDDYLNTVLPEPVLEATDERVSDGETPAVAHVLPPHAPYVGVCGEEWLPLFPDVEEWHGEQAANPGSRSQRLFSSGEIDPEKAWQAYRTSVRSTWAVTREYVGRWVSDGQTVVVTADHGELFGRYREFGLYVHPTRCYVPALVTVPFAVFKPRREVQNGAGSVEEKLRALGYAE